MMAMQKAYNRINWENYPRENTPLNETNLNKIDAALDEVDNRIITHEQTKLDKTTAYGMVTDITFNDDTGIFTVTKLNGSEFTIDTKLEKLAVSFRYDSANQRLIIILDDGTEQYVDMAALITQYEFLDSATLTFTLDESTGKITATIKKGSITGDMLEPNYLANVTVQAELATQKAAEAVSAAEAASVSEANAQYYSEQAKNISESLSGALRPMGTVVFADLPDIANAVEGDMYNISDEFTTTEVFKEGAGKVIPMGSNVYLTADKRWDILAGSPVTGVKGSAETTFRRGNVNITAENLGLGNVPNVTTNNQTPTYTVASSVAELTSGEKLSVAFGKIAKFIQYGLAKFTEHDEAIAEVKNMLITSYCTPVAIGGIKQSVYSLLTEECFDQKMFINIGAGAGYQIWVSCDLPPKELLGKVTQVRAGYMQGGTSGGMATIEIDSVGNVRPVHVFLNGSQLAPDGTANLLETCHWYVAYKKYTRTV